MKLKGQLLKFKIQLKLLKFEDAFDAHFIIFVYLSV